MSSVHITVVHLDDAFGMRAGNPVVSAVVKDLDPLLLLLGTTKSAWIFHVTRIFQAPNAVVKLPIEQLLGCSDVVTAQPFPIRQDFLVRCS